MAAAGARPINGVLEVHRVGIRRARQSGEKVGTCAHATYGRRVYMSLLLLGIRSYERFG